MSSLITSPLHSVGLGFFSVYSSTDLWSFMNTLKLWSWRYSFWQRESLMIIRFLNHQYPMYIKIMIFLAHEVNFISIYFELQFIGFSRIIILTGSIIYCSLLSLIQWQISHALGTFLVCEHFRSCNSAFMALYIFTSLGSLVFVRQWGLPSHQIFWLLLHVRSCIVASDSYNVKESPASPIYLKHGCAHHPVEKFTDSARVVPRQDLNCELT